MTSSSIIDWRADHNKEPTVRMGEITRFVDRISRNPNDVDLEVYVLIEECSNWHKAYKEVLSSKTSHLHT